MRVFKTGLFHFICEPHVAAGMRGTVMVTAARQTTVEVAAVGNRFNPPNVTIKVDEFVQWTGLAGGFHTVAEADDANSLIWNGGFHSPLAASEFMLTFTAPGLFHYICEPHVLEGMRGTVTVNGPMTFEVAAAGVSFIPPDIIIEVGDSIHWTGLAAGFHTVAEVPSRSPNR